MNFEDKLMELDKVLLIEVNQTQKNISSHVLYH